MKKRDLTKLALMGVALAMVSGSANADECCSSGTCVEGQEMAAHGCGGGCGGAPPPKPRNRQLSERNSGKGGMHQSCSNLNSCNNSDGNGNGHSNGNDHKNGNGSCHNTNGCNNSNGTKNRR